MSGPRDAESELLRLCARATLPPGGSERLQSLVRLGPDWSRVQWLGNRHGLTPLLHRHLSAHAGDLLPPDVREALSTTARTLAGSNLALAWELLRVLALFREHGIEAVPFKGPVLAQQLYGDPALRRMADLDLLLRREDILPAGDLLRAEGFQLEARLEQRHLATFFAEECELNLDHPRTGLHLELHWDFLPRYYGFRLLSTGLWERLERQALGGRDVPNLGTEDLLLMLCAHGAKHVWSDLSLITDVAELLRIAPEMRWDEVLERARQLRCERLLLLGVQLASFILDVPLPGCVSEAAAQEKALPALLRYVEHRLAASHPLPAGWDAVRARLFQARLQETVRDRLRFATGFSRLAVLHKMGHFVPPARAPAGG